ncbi:hypothetical protein COV77_02030 [Candidatus Pacearchaeota archaeon CG11_big_fil_rev_8_21_14_0_20_30_13]|nr:MAG: hypothetical protein COV77_02030 [Candidatus Pacearchaeota archaeon CG11_big_fil_rev_8_21_14_0_20_30_13]PIZ82272.1 MAG: hypothetical protein COX98_00435 [Candidatus Pacearchaeota archaeon CG_4_10_14_0_2_um_filter_30_11]
MVAKRKVVKKSSQKKSVTKQKASVKSAQVMVSDKKIKRTTNSLIFSIITFIISFVLLKFAVEKGSFLESLFGLIMIIAGAFIFLFVILEIIFYFMKRK